MFPEKTYSTKRTRQLPTEAMLGEKFPFTSFLTSCRLFMVLTNDTVQHIMTCLLSRLISFLLFSSQALMAIQHLRRLLFKMSLYLRTALR